jgi:hypothetical protein
MDDKIYFSIQNHLPLLLNLLLKSKIKGEKLEGQWGGEGRDPTAFFEYQFLWPAVSDDWEDMNTGCISPPGKTSYKRFAAGTTCSKLENYS